MIIFQNYLDKKQFLWYNIIVPNMVGVAQLIRAPGCGPGGRGFEPHHSPHKKSKCYVLALFIYDIAVFNPFITGIFVIVVSCGHTKIKAKK